jgi:hypothetical protein
MLNAVAFAFLLFPDPTDRARTDRARVADEWKVGIWYAGKNMVKNLVHINNSTDHPPSQTDLFYFKKWNIQTLSPIALIDWAGLIGWG